MNKRVFSLGIILILIFIFSLNVLVQASETMTVKANILATQLSVEVPSEIYLGEIYTGYKYDATFKINNTGTADIIVSTKIENYTGNIFNNLKMSNRSCESCSVEVNNFSVEISKPTSVGSFKPKTIYMYLDLTNYNGTIEQDMVNHSAEIIFTVVPA